jgi:hypothetical protein
MVETMAGLESGEVACLDPPAARYAQILRKRVAHACGRGPPAVLSGPSLWIIRTKGSFIMDSTPQIESVEISDAELDNVSGGAFEILYSVNQFIPGEGWRRLTYFAGGGVADEPASAPVQFG